MASGLRTLYPPLEAYDRGLLAVGDGHQLYWEECGNPHGKPAVFLHGGPGGGITTTVRRLFDPARYRVVLLDQRGCGQSRPHASEPYADLGVNTTWHLVSDLERLREDRGIDRWQVFGGSWGSALGLAYAESHPDRVTELVLRGIFTLRRSELDFYYGGAAGQLFPERWMRFLAPLGGPRFSGDTIAAYHHLLTNPDPDVHGPAAVAWSTWEAATITLEPDPALIAEFEDPAFALAFARIENHYFVHGAWLDDGQLIRDAGKLWSIPGTIIQGRYDAVCPARTAFELHRAWPEAEFYLIEGAGHAYIEPAIMNRLIRATDQYARPVTG